MAAAARQGCVGRAEEANPATPERWKRFGWEIPRASQRPDLQTGFWHFVIWRNATSGGSERNGREVTGQERDDFAISAVLRHSVYDCATVGERERERKGERCNPSATNIMEQRETNGENEEGGYERGCESARTRRCGRGSYKIQFQGVGLIPRIPRKYFIYYLHFVDT